MNKAGADLNRVGSSADSIHRGVVKPLAERSTPRRERADEEQTHESNREQQPKKRCQTCVKHECESKKAPEKTDPHSIEASTS